MANREGVHLGIEEVGADNLVEGSAVDGEGGSGGVLVVGGEGVGGFGSECGGNSTDGARGCIEVDTLWKEGRDGRGSDCRRCGEDVDLLVVPVERIGGFEITEGGWEGSIADEEVNLVQIGGEVLCTVDYDSVGGELAGLCDAMEVGPCVGSGLCVGGRVDYREGSVHRSGSSNGEGGGMTCESHVGSNA